MKKYKQVLENHHMYGVLIWDDNKLQFIFIEDDYADWIPKVKQFTIPSDDYTGDEMTVIKEYSKIWLKFDELINDKLDTNFIIRDIVKTGKIYKLDVYHFSFGSHHVRMDLRFSEDVLNQDSLRNADKPSMRLFDKGRNHRIYDIDGDEITLINGTQMVVHRYNRLSSFKLGDNKFDNASYDPQNSILLLYNPKPSHLIKLSRKMNAKIGKFKKQFIKKKIRRVVSGSNENFKGDEIPF